MRPAFTEQFGNITDVECCSHEDLLPPYEDGTIILLASKTAIRAKTFYCASNRRRLPRTQIAKNRMSGRLKLACLRIKTCCSSAGRIDENGSEFLGNRRGNSSAAGARPRSWHASVSYSEVL